MLFSASYCGHFALGAFSETYVEDVVFEINVSTQNQSSKMTKSKNVKCDTKINNRIIFRYHVVSINTFWYMKNHFVWHFFKLYDLVYVWYFSHAESLPPTGWEEEMLTRHVVLACTCDGNLPSCLQQRYTCPRAPQFPRFTGAARGRRSSLCSRRPENQITDFSLSEGCF